MRVDACVELPTIMSKRFTLQGQTSSVGRAKLLDSRLRVPFRAGANSFQALGIVVPVGDSIVLGDFNGELLVPHTMKKYEYSNLGFSFKTSARSKSSSQKQGALGHEGG